MHCKKCGHTDINTNYIVKNSSVSERSYSDNELIELEKATRCSPSCERYIAIKEHLEMHCRNCHYSWRDNVKDAQQR